MAPLEFIHSDMCEINSVLMKGGKKSFMTLIDDASRFFYVYLLKSKYEALDWFKIYKTEVKNKLERKIKRLRLDHGGEYLSSDFDLFYKEYGIIHERMSPYSPESNGVTKRKNHTLTDLINAMLDTIRSSKEWWGRPCWLRVMFEIAVLPRIKRKPHIKSEKGENHHLGMLEKSQYANN